jgi:hypothetical protein
VSTQHPRSNLHRHIIRPDGTIRIVTQGPIRSEDDETVLELAKFHKPGQWFYDFDRKKLFKYTNAQLHQKANASRQATAARKAAHDAELQDLKTLVGDTSPETRAALNAMAALLGLDIT